MFKDHPGFISFLVRHALFGFGVAWVATMIILATDFSNIATLVMNSDVGFFALGIMVVLMGITFSSLQIAFALLSEPYDQEPAPVKPRVPRRF